MNGKTKTRLCIIGIVLCLTLSFILILIRSQISIVPENVETHYLLREMARILRIAALVLVCITGHTKLKHKKQDNNTEQECKKNPSRCTEDGSHVPTDER